MKKIVIFAAILFAISNVFAQDLSWAEGHALLDNMVPHNQADFGFSAVEYTEIAVTGIFSGHTEQECLDEFDSYTGSYTHYFNVTGQTNSGADVYDESDGGYFLFVIGGFVDNSGFGTAPGSGFYGLNGFAFSYNFEILAEVTYYGNDAVTFVDYITYTAPNSFYDLGDVIFGSGAVPGIDWGNGVTGTVDAGVGVAGGIGFDSGLPNELMLDCVMNGHPENVGYWFTLTVDDGAPIMLELCVDLTTLGYVPLNLAYFVDGAWNYYPEDTVTPLDWTGDCVSFPIDPTVTRADVDIPIVLSTGDGWLPVVLSDFATAVFVNEFVEISWTTQSSANMSLWNLYREDSIIHSEAAVNGTEPHEYIYEDIYVTNGETYLYYLEAVENDGTTTMFGPVSATMEGNPIEVLPTTTQLLGNYPNPFNPVTNIKFNVKADETAKLTIFDIKGRVVAKAAYEPGEHSYTWEANSSASGVYFYKLESPSHTSVKKMMLLK